MINNINSKICTFSQLCSCTAKKFENNTNILYELSNDIALIISEYNKMNFLTVTSQPGGESINNMYKSEYHSHKERTPENILCKVIRKQRPYIRGYMKKSMANFIYKQLQHEEHLFVRTTDNNFPFPFDIKFASVNFLNDYPILTESVDWSNIEETKNIPDADWSFDLKVPLHRSFDLLFGAQYPNIISTDIVEFDLIDIRWHNNSYIWYTLLKIIKNYYTSPFILPN